MFGQVRFKRFNNLVFRFVLGIFLSVAIVVIAWSSYVIGRLNDAQNQPLLPEADRIILSMVEYAVQANLDRKDLAGEGSGSEKVLAEIDKVSKAIGLPVRLVEISSIEIPQNQLSMLREGKTSVYLEAIGARLLKRYFIPIPGKDLVLEVGPSHSGPKMSAGERFNFLIILIAIAVLMGWILSRPSLRLFYEVERLCQRLAANELSARISLGKWAARTVPFEVNAIFHSLNLLAEHNQKFVENAQEMTNAVAHELRTPTARMRFRLEMLAMAQSDEQREEKLSELDADLSEIDDFIEELIAYNRLDRGSALRLAPIVVKDVFEAEKSALFHIVGDRKIDFQEEEPDLAVTADRKLFARALRNLMSNAIRHCDKAIRVVCERTSEGVHINVDDDGAGIPPESRGKVFDPFARLDSSRNRRTGGFGLGLAIVRKIADLHGARADVTEAPAPFGGARFTLIWPRAAPSDVRKSQAPAKSPSPPAAAALLLAVLVSAAAPGCLVIESVEEQPDESEMLNFSPRILGETASPSNARPVVIRGCSASFSVGEVEDLDLSDSLQARWFVDDVMVSWSTLADAKGNALREGPGFEFFPERHGRGFHALLLVVSDGFAEGSDLKAPVEGKGRDTYLWSVDSSAAECPESVSLGPNAEDSK